LIEIPRALARQFRALLRRCSASRGQRGPGPPVLVRAGPDGLTVCSGLDEAALYFHLDGQRESDELAFRAELLARVEGRDRSSVNLERVGPAKGRARWQEGKVPRSEEFEALLPDAAPSFPPLPQRLVAQPVALMTALAEAARTAAQYRVRLALAHALLAGGSGEVVGTDGRQLLIQGGFELPWEDNVLVPALPVYAAPELSAEGLRVGWTNSHVALVNGPWAVLLKTEGGSRYPDYRSVIPATRGATSVLEVEAGDAAFLLENLGRLPGAEEDFAPVTLELGGQVALRVSHAGQVTEAVLSRSRASGPAVRVAMNRRYLLRALQLGFARVQVVAPDKPLLCRDNRRTYLWMPLDNAEPPSPDALRLDSASAERLGPPAADRPVSPRRRREPVPAPEPDPPRPPRNGAAPRPAPPPAQEPAQPPGLEGLIAEAEEVRSALGESHARLGRLLAALKHHRRRDRAVQSALQSLRQLPASLWQRTRE
jgi:hypothetical protein